MVCAEHFLATSFPGLRLHCQAVNVTRGLAGGADAESAVLDAMPDTLARRLRLANAVDADVYAAASEELDRRIALGPAFEERLAAFRARCDALSASGSPAVR
jgi:hypothetical protein